MLPSQLPNASITTYANANASLTAYYCFAHSSLTFPSQLPNSFFLPNMEIISIGLQNANR